jgi:hypothetical protein
MMCSITCAVIRLKSVHTLESNPYGNSESHKSGGGSSSKTGSITGGWRFLRFGRKSDKMKSIEDLTHCIPKTSNIISPPISKVMSFNFPKTKK